MDAELDTEAVLLVRSLLSAARAKSAALTDQLHPAWLQAAWERVGLPGTPAQSEAAARRTAPLLANVYGLRFDSIGQFAHRAHRIAVLPRSEMIRVLSAIALHADRERVRRSIGRGVRASIVGLIGEAAYAALLEAPPFKGAVTVALNFDALQPDQLASQGYAALRAQRAWHSKQILAWVRMALPPDGAEKNTARSSASIDTDPVLDRLPTFFPEHSWLFGSPMDRALLA